MQPEAFRYDAVIRIAPQGNDELAGKCYNHRLAQSLCILGALVEPLYQRTVGLELHHAPGQLDHAFTHPRVARVNKRPRVTPRIASSEDVTFA
jgi:hypothetical protein